MWCSMGRAELSGILPNGAVAIESNHTGTDVPMVEVGMRDEAKLSAASEEVFMTADADWPEMTSGELSHESNRSLTVWSMKEWRKRTTMSPPMVS